MSGEEFFCCLNLATSTQLTVYRNLTSTEEVELFFPPEITLHKTFPVYCHIFGDLCHVYPGKQDYALGYRSSTDFNQIPLIFIVHLHR